MVAALYVLKDGPYVGVEGVDAWPEARDARLYAGPHPVVAHPPCERWGHYWPGSTSEERRRELGDDNGCFAAALASVRSWGGVLEHPAGSRAWKHHGIVTPLREGGWVLTQCSGYTCHVEQGHYGHLARKATWLYYVGPKPPDLTWGPSGAVRLVEKLSKRQRTITPTPFRDLLLDLARRSITRR